MIQHDGNPLQASTATVYSGMFKRIITFFSFVYVVVAFGLSGIPGVSRLALFSAAIICIALFFNYHKLKIQPWVFLLILFSAFMIVPALAIENMPLDQMGTMMVVLAGTASIGISLKNRILSYKVLVYGAIVAAIINIIAIHMGIDTAAASDKGRFSGLMANPNALCLRMAFASYLIWLFPERFNWPVKLFGIFLTFYGMYVTGSRKGVVLVAALLLMVIFNHIIKLSKPKLIIYLTVIPALAGSFYGLAIQLAEKYSTKIVAVNRITNAVSGHDKSFNDRLILIDTGFKLWKESPVFGNGFYQFSKVSGFGGYAHNNYIELAVDGGIIGLALFYAMHLIIIRNAMRQPFIFMLRLVLFMGAILLMDMAVVSFYDKAVMCVLGTLLVVSSESYALQTEKKYETT